MKNVIMLIWIGLFSCESILNAQQEAFISKWQTDNRGSSCISCITIPTIGSGYNYMVDWDNDGSYDQTGINGSITHDFRKPGVYTIRIMGDFPQIYFNNPVWDPISSDAQKLIDIVQWGNIVWYSFRNAFLGCVNLNPSATDVPDLRNVSDMSYAFAFTAFNQNINNWNVRYIENMSYMFYKSPFDQPLDEWNVVNVTNMEHMFDETPFNHDISKWDVRKVTNMNYMFANSLFNQDLNSWNVSKVSTMAGIFHNSPFNKALHSWDVSNVRNMSWMFSYTPFNQDIHDWNLKMVTDISYMFTHSSFNQPIGNWDVSEVSEMAYLFADSPFNKPINNWNVSKVVQMEGVFYNTQFDQALDHWNVSNVYDMDNLFEGASFNQSLASWDVSHVRQMDNMFHNSHFNQAIGNWDVSRVVSMSGMFSGRSHFNQDIGKWNVGNVRNMQFMFYDSEFNQPIGDWDVSHVEYMQFMFGKSKFNHPINKWDVRNVMSFESMFNESQFNQSLSNWTFRDRDVHPNFLKSFLSYSAMDCSNYSASISGWASNPDNPYNLSLGAVNMRYGINVKEQREFLANAKHWILAGDKQSNSLCAIPVGSAFFEEGQSINVYPNLVRQILSIQFQKPVKPGMLLIIQDLAGKRLDVQNPTIGEIVQQLNVEFLPPGFYLLHIFSNGKWETTKRFIKE